MRRLLFGRHMGHRVGAHQFKAAQEEASRGCEARDCCHIPEGCAFRGDAGVGIAVPKVAAGQTHHGFSESGVGFVVVNSSVESA